MRKLKKYRILVKIYLFFSLMFSKNIIYLRHVLLNIKSALVADTLIIHLKQLTYEKDTFTLVECGSRR